MTLCRSGFSSCARRRRSHLSASLAQHESVRPHPDGPLTARQLHAGVYYDLPAIICRAVRTQLYRCDCAYSLGAYNIDQMPPAADRARQNVHRCTDRRSVLRRRSVWPNNGYSPTELPIDALRSVSLSPKAELSRSPDSATGTGTVVITVADGH